MADSLAKKVLRGAVEAPGRIACVAEGATEAAGEMVRRSIQDGFKEGEAVIDEYIEKGREVETAGRERLSRAAKQFQNEAQKVPGRLARHLKAVGKQAILPAWTLAILVTDLLGKGGGGG